MLPAESDQAPPVESELELLVRDHRARLVASLASWCGDLYLAEDAFSYAVEKALTAWQAGIPAQPVAWLNTAARNRVRDLVGSAERQRTRALSSYDDASSGNPLAAKDQTLGLMLACAHPALDRSLHAPLILQSVMGVATADIATALAIPQATLAKRLVRAKQKLRANRVVFTIPERIEPDRIQAVLAAIYGAYATDWLRIAPEGSPEKVSEEAIHASQLLLAAIPEHREARGLAALLLFLQARADARLRDGVLVPTEEQDPASWDHRLIQHAEELLSVGLRRYGVARHGTYELQAAIQGAHCARRHGEPVAWEVIGQLYDALLKVSPSKGALVARVVAISHLTGPTWGLERLAELLGQDPTLAAFQPFHAAQAALLQEAGQHELGLQSLQRAIDLATHPPSRRYLERLKQQQQAG